MSSLRNAYLDVLGIDRWVPRSATGEAAAEAPVVALEPAPARAHTTSPTARAPEAPRVSPTSTYQRGPLAGDWVGLREQVAGCTACEQLCRTRTQTVFGVGNQQAEWLIIGEAPGAEEDRQGEPFVGRAGQLLNAMLLAIGLPRETVY